MPRNIRLVRQDPVAVVNRGYLAYRFRVDASLGSLIPNEIFLYLRAPGIPPSTVPVDSFQTVAGPMDLLDYPVNAPSLSAQFPYFRLSYVELDFRSADLMELAYGQLVHRVQLLVSNLNALDNLTPTETLTIS